MDRAIIDIQMRWAERTNEEGLSAAEARLGIREEVYGYLVTIGAIQAALEWRWKLAVAVSQN